MQRLNPTGSLLRARSFVARHDYIFALLCLLNVNMGVLNTSALLVGSGREREASTVVEGRGGGTSVIGETPMDLSLEMVLAQGLVDDMASVYEQVHLRGTFTLDDCFSAVLGARAWSLRDHHHCSRRDENLPDATAIQMVRANRPCGIDSIAR